MANKKILLVTIFRVPNFGSVLQAFATQCILENLGHKCQILNYDHNNGEWAKSHGVKSSYLKNKLLKWLGIKANHRKAKLLDKFINKNFHLTKRYSSSTEIKHELGEAYDVYIIGSDQVWNTRFTNCDPNFLLQFADKSKDRISIASSFACEHLSPEHKEIFQQNLKLFKAISVREKAGLKIIENLQITTKAYIILDPTLLLNSKQWDYLGNRSNINHNKYILLYMWCYAFEPRPYIYHVLKSYQEKLNCKVIVLEGYNRHDSYMHSPNIIDATESSVSDFLGYFANAELVITSSFHGTAFALNYGVPLISIVPKNSEDDRQSSLLKLLGLSQCQLKVDEDINNANPFYDKNQEQSKLEFLRQDSIAWINKAI